MDTLPALKPMLTANEVAALLRLHIVVVRNKCRSGEIPAIKVGANPNSASTHWRIPRDYVESILRAEQPNWPTTNGDPLK